MAKPLKSRVRVRVRVGRIRVRDVYKRTLKASFTLMHKKAMHSHFIHVCVVVIQLILTLFIFTVARELYKYIYV